jgi:hypothetical protein
MVKHLLLIPVIFLILCAMADDDGSFRKVGPRQGLPMFLMLFATGLLYGLLWGMDLCK